MNSRFVSVAIVLSAAALLAVVAPTRGQDALGSGNALDANPSLNTAGVNLRQWEPNFRARNLVVTGNVPGGRGFRGSVGYTAARDFRGVAGSDSLLQFRRDSAFSDIRFVGLGRTAEQFRFGQNIGELSFRRDTTPPPVGTISPNRVQAQRAGYTFDMANRLSMDRILQSVSADGVTDVSSRPSVVGLVETQEGTPYYISASSLRGVTIAPAADRARQSGLTEFDMLHVFEERKELAEEGEAETIGSPFMVSFDAPFTAVSQVVATTTNDLTTPEQVSDRVDVVDGTDYERILRRIVLRYAESDDVALSLDPKLVDQLGEEYEDLRGKLIGADPTLLVSGATDATGGTGDPTTGDPGTGDPGTEDPGDPGTPLIDTALAHGGTISRLTSDKDRGRFFDLLRTAEDRLREGEYFFAERRFIRALRFIPGHPMATAGLGHAQLGAGLYNSSSLTLRNLLMKHPEMIDVRYEVGLLPNRVRLLEAVDVLREGSRLPDEQIGNGFLLAYIGHQLNDRALVEDGLSAIEEAGPEEPLLPLLREIWLAPAVSPEPDTPGK
jgi:hypothetical protein